MENPEYLLTFDVAAKRLAVTTAELCALVVQDRLPAPFRLAGGLKFFSTDIDNFIGTLKAQRNKL